MNPPKCCQKPMELKCVGRTDYTHLTNRAYLLFQCIKCGNVVKKKENEIN